MSAQDLQWYMKNRVSSEDKRIIVYHVAETRKRLLVSRDGAGIEKPIRFAILASNELEKEGLGGIPELLVTMVTSMGGTATIRKIPDETIGVINVTVGSMSADWGNYSVNIYASDVITQAAYSLQFNLEDIGQWEL